MRSMLGSRQLLLSLSIPFLKPLVWLIMIIHIDSYLYDVFYKKGRASQELLVFGLSKALGENQDMQTLIKSPALSLGDTVGVIAPSLPLLPSWQTNYDLGLQTIRALGFEIKEGKTMGLRRWWSAGTAQEQADDINAMFADPDVRAIFTLTGGFSALRVLPLLDYALIRENPKPFIGMSDVSQYQLAMLQKAGLVGFHGNEVLNGFGWCMTEVDEARQAEILQSYRDLLLKPEALGVLPVETTEVWQSGSARGRLIGGNLKRITPLVGTQYFPELAWWEGAILFWEEIGETLYDITLNLQLLKEVGVLERIEGMIVGRLLWVNEYFEEIEHPSPKEAVLDVLDGFDFPILHVSGLGHHVAMPPLPIGVEVKIDSEIRVIDSVVVTS